MDLHKIIDPVLRPTYIANRRSFNTVVTVSYTHLDVYKRQGTDYIGPADLPEEIAAKVQEAALKAYRAAGVEVDVYKRQVSAAAFWTR